MNEVFYLFSHSIVVFSVMSIVSMEFIVLYVISFIGIRPYKIEFS